MIGEKIKLCRLYERQSSRGNKYFVGRLGGARIVVLRDEQAELSEGTIAVWEICLSPADEPAPWRAPSAPRTTAPRASKAPKPDPSRPFIEDELPPWTP